MTAVAPPLLGPRARRPVRIPVARPLRIAGLGLLVVTVTAGGMATLFGGLVLAGIASVLIWRSPGWAAVVLIALLPVNRFLILLAFHLTGSSAVMLAGQLWKDLFIAVLLLRAVHELLVGPRPHLRYLDLLVLAFMAIATLYLAHPGGALHLTLMNRVLGYRADAVFLFAYVVGRAIPFDRRQLRWLLTGLIPGTVVVALVAAGQFAWPDWFIRTFDRLHFQEFAGGGLAEVELVRDRGIGGVDLPRASSLLLSDLALSFYCVFAAGVAAALFFTARRPARIGLAGFTTVCSIATAVLTVTRSAVLASVIVVVVVGLLARSIARATVLWGICLLGAVAALSLNVIPADDLGALADPQEGSTQSHIEAIQLGFNVLQEQPMGRGLGTAGTIGQRFVPEQALTSENWFLQIATELGLVAGLLFVAITLIATGLAVSACFRLRDLELRRIALVVAGGSAGFLLMANVLHAWEVSVLSMSFWLLVGVVASGRDRDGALA